MSLLLEARVTWSGMLAVIVHADVILTRSKVTRPVRPLERTKVGLFYVYLLRHFGVQLKTDG